MKLVIVILLVFIMGVLGLPPPPVKPTLPPMNNCKPVLTQQKRVCDKLMKSCNANNSPMKWVAKGCRVKGSPVGDGGCQCDGYCGYSCRAPCNRDKQCFWNMAANACYVKATNTLGVPIKSESLVLTLR